MLLYIALIFWAYLQFLSCFNMQRPESVKIDAQDIKGTRFTVSLSDLPARVFQHEFDHLQVRPPF